VFTSWNGKTAVRSYDLIGGPDPEHLSLLSSHIRAGFETNVSLAGLSEAFVGTVARDGAGIELGHSAILAVANGSAVQAGTF
jgi:hypothetical protein